MSKPLVRCRPHARRPHFMLTGFDKRDIQEKHRLLEKITSSSLNGMNSESNSFDPSITHVVCKKPSRSEKFLGACAMGKWIVTEDFIHDSYAQSKWLKEELYEWSPSMRDKVAWYPDCHTLLSVPRQCRLKYSGTNRGPFVGWYVAVVVAEKTRQKVYKRILECGGAIVTSLRFPLVATNLINPKLTHVFLDERQIYSDKGLAKEIKMLRDADVACVSPIYLGDYITSFPKPELGPYFLPKGYNPEYNLDYIYSKPPSMTGTNCRTRKECLNNDSRTTELSHSTDSSSCVTAQLGTICISQDSSSFRSSQSSNQSSRRSSQLSKSTSNNINLKQTSLRSANKTPDAVSCTSSSVCDRSFMFETKSVNMAKVKIKLDHSKAGSVSRINSAVTPVSAAPRKASMSSHKRAEGLKSKTAFKVDPSQGVISKYFTPCKKELRDMSSLQGANYSKSRTTTQSDDDDVIIIEPKDVTTIFSPLKTRSRRRTLLHNNETSCIPTKKVERVTSSKCNNNVAPVSSKPNPLKVDTVKQSIVNEDKRSSCSHACDMFSPIKTRSRVSLLMENAAVSGIQYVKRDPVLEAMQAELNHTISTTAEQTSHKHCNCDLKNTVHDISEPLLTRSLTDTAQIVHCQAVASTTHCDPHLRSLKSTLPSSKSDSGQLETDAQCCQTSIRKTRCKVPVSLLTLGSEIRSTGSSSLRSESLICKEMLSCYDFTGETDQQKCDFLESQDNLARLEGKILDSSVESCSNSDTNNSISNKLLSPRDSLNHELDTVSKSDVADTHLHSRLANRLNSARPSTTIPHSNKQLQSSIDVNIIKSDVVRSKVSNTPPPAHMEREINLSKYQCVVTKADYLPESPQPVNQIQTRAKRSYVRLTSKVRSDSVVITSSQLKTEESRGNHHGLKRKSAQIAESGDQPIVKKQKFRTRLPWTPLCHLNQCHDDTDEDSDKAMSLPLSGADADVLGIVMDDDTYWPLKTLASVRSVVSTCRYPSAQTLSRLMRNLLYLSKCKFQSNKAYTVLCHILELHPPVRPALQKVYLHALHDYEKNETEQKKEWNFIRKIISGALNVEVENRQEQHNCYLLLKYIMSIIQKDFNHHYSRHDINTKKRSPLLAQIIWPNGLKVMNGVCQEMIICLMDIMQIDELQLPYKMELSYLLQSMVSMTAHCLSTIGNATWQNLDQLPEQACLFARELAYRINGELVGCQHISVILNSLNPPWLTFKVTHMLLDLYDDVMIPLGLSHPSEKLKSLKTVLSYYIYLVPPTGRASLISPHKKTDDKEIRALKVLADTNHVLGSRYHYPSAIIKMSPRDMISSSLITSEHKQSRKETLGHTKRTETFSDGALKHKMSNINKRNSKGETPLHVACMKNNVKKVRELLQVPGINVNMEDFAGWTPLHEACNLGFVDCVQELLQYKPPRKITSYFKTDVEEPHRADLTKKSWEGVTALHDAVMNNHIEIAAILLRHGGESLIRMKTVTGSIPLELAISEDMKQLLMNPVTSPQIMNEISVSQDLSCSQCSQSLSCATKKSTPFQVLEEKYSDVTGPGHEISVTQCDIYMMLFHHLVKSYVKFYDLISLSRLSKHSLELMPLSCKVSRSQTIIGNAKPTVDEEIPPERLDDINTLKHLKTYCKMFEKHLNRLATEMGDSTPKILTMLYVMVECANGI